jgi:hypothetical protein
MVIELTLLAEDATAEQALKSALQVGADGKPGKPLPTVGHVAGLVE